jgi:hypothetical protein
MPRKDAGHPGREFDVHEHNYVDFEIVRWKDTRGVTTPRWVLCGAVAI